MTVSNTINSSSILNKGKDCGTCTQQTHQRFSCNAGGMHEISDQTSAYFCFYRKRQSC